MSLLRAIIMVSMCCTVYSMNKSSTNLSLRTSLWQSTLHSCIKTTGIALETVGRWGIWPACYFSVAGGILWGMGYKADEWSNKAYYCNYPPGQPDETISTMTIAGKYMLIISSAGVPLCLCLKSIGKRLPKNTLYSMKERKNLMRTMMRAMMKNRYYALLKSSNVAAPSYPAQDEHVGCWLLQQPHLPAASSLLREGLLEKILKFPVHALILVRQIAI